MSDNDNKDPVSNELKPQVQSTTDGALQQLKAQLALIESCLRAGRYSWALETVRELNSYGLNLEQTLADMVRPIAQPVLLPSEPPAPVVALAKDGAEKTGIDVAKDESKPDAVAPPAAKVWTPPSPEQVQRSLNKMFGHLSEASDDGDVVVISFNGHLLDLPKAQRLVEPLKWFIKRGHVVLFQETNRDALKYLSNETGYGLNVSHRNERGQAVGVLYHPRIEWLGQPYYHDYLTDIPGHPEWKTTLRPALQRQVRDRKSGKQWTFIDIHTKSNLGGPDETAPIRRLQFEMLVKDIARQEADGTVFGATVIGGDMNAAINLPATTEIEPLIQAGFALVPNPENRSTYFYKGQPNGQFDGFFIRGFAAGDVSDVWIPLPLETKGERWFYSELTDHMPAFTTIKV
ncbi:MAG: hypothetical protein IPJ49_21255 [Candidatus Obscuribacter sp.]|nr:hypothetical protein [Candidatus Obscuribacter sp.]